MMRLCPNGKKLEERARLENDVAAFLQAGGVIEQCDHTDNKTYRDRLNRQKRKGSRGLPPGFSSTALPGRHIQHTTDGRKSVGAGPGHQWRDTYKAKGKGHNSFGIAASGVTI